MKSMKNQKPDAERVWKQFEDTMVPRLGLSVVERAVYSHLLRHSRLEGKRQLRFSIAWLCRGARVSATPTRQAVRRLTEHGVLRLIRRSNAGHTVEVRLPEEIRAAADPSVAAPGGEAADTRMEGIDFMENAAAKEAIHARDQGFCFYCLRRLEEEEKTVDHVVPQAQGGGNSYRNLVSCCADCNCYKAGGAAGDFLRRLYREGRLTAVELRERLRALDALAAGKLRPNPERLGGAIAALEKARLQHGYRTINTEGTEAGTQRSEHRGRSTEVTEKPGRIHGWHW